MSYVEAIKGFSVKADRGEIEASVDRVSGYNYNIVQGPGFFEQDRLGDNVACVSG